MNQKKQTCTDCLFSGKESLCFEIIGKEGGHITKIECRRYPVLHYSNLDYWCGEFKNREEENEN